MGTENRIKKTENIGIKDNHHSNMKSLYKIQIAYRIEGLFIIIIYNCLLLMVFNLPDRNWPNLCRPHQNQHSLFRKQRTTLHEPDSQNDRPKPVHHRAFCGV